MKGKCKRTRSRGGRDIEMETVKERKEHGDRTERCPKIRQKRCQRKLETNGPGVIKKTQLEYTQE